MQRGCSKRDRVEGFFYNLMLSLRDIRLFVVGVKGKVLV
jgi:hypothetical protein